MAAVGVAYTNVGPYSNGTADEDGQTTEQYIPTFFCRALYDYQTRDTSSLSFRKNDVIEVLTRLESGWWDGLLGDERGWFPSNYVTVISDEEAELVLSGYEGPQQVQQIDSRVHITQEHYISEPEWGGDASNPPNVLLELAHAVQGTGEMSNDFWMPQVTSDGQVSRPFGVGAQQTKNCYLRRFTM